MLTPQDFLANLASIVNCYHHHQGAAASQEVDDKWKSKDIETPDDDHSNEHQSQVSSGLLSAFLDLSGRSSIILLPLSKPSILAVSSTLLPVLVKRDTTIVPRSTKRSTISVMGST